MSACIDDTECDQSSPRLNLDVETVHMNGRVYDYNVGRFTSVDPFIQGHGNSQGLQPYSYVMNNPLGYTDPTGYSAEQNESKLDKLRDRTTSATSTINGGFGVDKVAAADNGKEGDGNTTPTGSGNTGVLNQVSVAQITGAEQGVPNIEQQFNDMVWERGEFEETDNALSLSDGASLIIPGWDVGVCVIKGCSGTDWAWASAGILPIGKAAKAYKIYDKATDITKSVSPTVGELRKAKLKDAHHIIQNAAVRDLPGYNTNSAPGIQLYGGGRGTPHHSANQVQKQRGGGVYAAERRIGYKALRRAGVTKTEARSAIGRADAYFESIGVTPSTPTRVPRRWLPK